MKREEAIEILQGAIKKPNTKDGYLGQALDMAIKALEQEPCEDATLKDIFCMGCEYKEQEPILDKIRAEIDEQYDRVHPYNISCAEGLEMALEIIDKYKAESEDKE